MRCRDLAYFSSLERGQIRLNAKGDTEKCDAGQASSRKRIRVSGAPHTCSKSRSAENGSHNYSQKVPV